MILNTFGNSSFIRVNKTIAQKTGIEAAALLAELLEIYVIFDYDRENGFVDYNGLNFFPINSIDLKERTTMDKKQLIRAINRLESLEFIEKAKLGDFSQFHIGIRFDTVEDCLNGK